MKRIGIIGAGFSGTMTAVNLIENSNEIIEILLFEKENPIGKGIAYSPYSKKQLLNVPTSKMSAFKELPDHFFNWVKSIEEYKNVDESILAGAFLPRYIYGQYIEFVWNEALANAKAKSIKVRILRSNIIDLERKNAEIELIGGKDERFIVDYCVLATGNLVPRNQTIENMDFYSSSNYFQNPWKMESVENLSKNENVLVIGNGLTMVDTVLALQERNFKGIIYSISPNGYHILSHRHAPIKYSKLVDELPEELDLKSIRNLIVKHVRAVRKLGVSAEPVIDSLRPFSQNIWRNFSLSDKREFLRKYRHAWGVARHRIPIHMNDFLLKLMFSIKLKVFAGKIKSLNEVNGTIEVSFIEKNSRTEEKIYVSRVINCTGPESNIQLSQSQLLKKCLEKGIISQDEFYLGFNADPTNYQLIGANGEVQNNIFTLGTNLKGIFWESTAVNELRTQAQNLANYIVLN
jgi:uncharacterized NAD(P)/FAD-binding protein YdhS